MADWVSGPNGIEFEEFGERFGVINYPVALVLFFLC